MKMDERALPQTTLAQSKPLKKKSGPPVKRLIWPGIIFVAIMTQIPFIVTIYYSLQEWNILRPAQGIQFVGLSNFIEALTSSHFLHVVLNTFILTFCSIILCLILGMAFALMLNRNFFAKGLVRTMMVSPFFVMPAVAGIVWKTMVFDPSFGFSYFIANVTATQPIEWLSHYPLVAIIMIITWQWAPFFMLVLLAGLQSLPQDQLEAASLDGASNTQKIVYVIIPHLFRYLEVVTMLGLIFILQIFGQIYVTTSGGPGFSSTNLTFLTYRDAFQNWEIGMGSAVGVIAVIITLIVMMFLFNILRRRFKEELS
ncbi:MAG TPA: sugar ABC transporter permease [Bacillales bacterium]|nr:sugar ABC transporter permease [Bacillales bacterium]